MSSNSIHFIVHPLPGSDDQLIDRLKELSDKINKQGLQSAPALQNISVQQVVIGQNHIALLLQDGRICRVYFTIYSERLNLTKNEKTTREGSLRQERLPRGIRIADSPLILIRGDDVNAMTDSAVGRFASSVGSVTSTVARTAVSNASIATTARLATRPRGRIVRAVGRGRGSGVIVGSRPLLPASVVPEELINQCQVVLQGKSRSLIIRELQRTNLDVNLAVNNLLSRDDEGDEDGDNCESYMSDDLMSLLDAGIHSDHPSVIIDSDSMFGDDMFTYSTLRGTRRRISKVEHDLDRERESIFRLRERSRWLDSVTSDEATLLRLDRDRADGLATSADSKKSNLNPLSIDDELYYWLDKDGQSMKFSQIASMFSELIGVSTTGHLHQWRWADSDPLICESGGHNHPKAQTLGLTGEKIVGISACNVRASLWTESGKVATWADEALARVAFKIDHPALLFSELQPERISSLHTCNLFTCARLENNSIYWWGVLPFGQRKRNLDKLKSKNKKIKGNKENKNLTEITAGSQVCLTSSPIYQIGAIGFAVIDGVPKVGQLMKAAWSLDETCRFKIKGNNNAEKLDLQLNLNSETYKPDMPPPPSPASSTCSDTSGPTAANQLPLNRKRKHLSLSVDATEKRDEEEWPLKDVVFIEDVKTVPVGKVLKVDGSYVVVHFPLSKDISPELSGAVRSDDPLQSQLANSRILRKDELQLVKGLGPPKVPDCFQRIPKKKKVPTATLR